MTNTTNVIRAYHENAEVIHDDAPAFSEDRLAQAFTRRHSDEFRYVKDRGRWMRWRGTHWQADRTVEVYDLSRRICRESALMANREDLQRRLASAATAAAVERLARADRRHAATADQWDVDAMLLGTPGGVINLRTGEMLPARPEHYITKLTSVAPDPTVGIGLWSSFLQQVTDGDDELIDFLQRAVGYSLTGDIREHALFFLYGTGSNGKSKFLEAVSGILNDYHKTAPAEVFTASNWDRHPTELAMLRGARLVTAIETEEGRQLAEARIKALTGGDVIAARFMRQDFFEFYPTFKIMIAGNHKPQLRNVDEAIRRRMHLVPFDVTIPAEERDLKLGDKLRAEWPGILHWMIEGAIVWQKEGLSPPQRVRDATTAYLSDEDLFSTWATERCETIDGIETRSMELYQSWCEWCEHAGEMPGSLKRFSQLLEGRGFEKTRLSTGHMGFKRIQLRPRY